MNLTRRDFVKTGFAGASALAATSTFAAEEKKVSKGLSSDRVELGKTGIKCSRVAMGTGFNGGNRSSAQTRMGLEGFKKLMLHGYDQGINFYDMADLYGSHDEMKHVLKEISRDDLVLLTKIWFTNAGILKATDRAIPEVERFQKELGVDMIDIVLIHCVTDKRWTDHRAQMMEEMEELKEKGKIRAVGVSCHDFGALEVAAKEPWVDVIFARINHKQIIMDGTPEEVSEVLKTARNNGKGVVGMKIYGAGKMAQDAEERDKSLRYVWGNDLVDHMTIGFEKQAQVNDTMEHLNRVLKS